MLVFRQESVLFYSESNLGFEFSARNVFNTFSKSSGHQTKTLSHAGHKSICKSSSMCNPNCTIGLLVTKENLQYSLMYITIDVVERKLK